MTDESDNEDGATGGSRSHVQTRRQTQREKDEAQWEPYQPPPELTIDESMEGENWASEPHEIQPGQTDEGDVTPLTPLQIQSNLYVLKKKKRPL
jgi:hypothetical protein